MTAPVKRRWTHRDLRRSRKRFLRTKERHGPQHPKTRAAMARHTEVVEGLLAQGGWWS